MRGHLEDIICGLCSKIPSCCIKAYPKWLEFCIEQNGKFQTAMKCYSDKGYKYIPCDKCLKEEIIVELENCGNIKDCLFED